MNQPVTAAELANLLDQHANSMALFASQWSDSPDDCVQEAFVQLAAQIPSPERPLAWLYRVVRRRAINDLRGKQRRIKREQSVAQPEATLLNPSASLEEKEEQQHVLDCLELLPESSRELVVLRIWSGLKWKEIAEIIDCSTSAAQRRYVVALEKLKQRLEDKCLTKPK